TNTATVKPYVGMDDWGGSVFGEPFEIACTWAAKSEQMRDSLGAEFVTRNQIYTEDHRPRYLDLILLNGSTDWQEIRAVTGWDMSFFDEVTDFLLVTGWRSEESSRLRTTCASSRPRSKGAGQRLPCTRSCPKGARLPPR